MSTETVIKETTLENVELTGMRRDGNTTRQVDNAIRILFEGKVCVCLDHHENGQMRQSNSGLFDRVMKRLQSEHSWLLKEKSIYFDRSKFEISLDPKHGILKPGKPITFYMK